MTWQKTRILVLAVSIGVSLSAAMLYAQGGEKYRGRLSPVPALGIAPAEVAGVGAATATLNGRKLTVSGTFEKMASAATTAHLYVGPVTGVRGDKVLDLTVTPSGDGTTGSLAGTFDLTPDQADAFKKGRFYIQIHSKGAPTGHLFGWLLKQ